MCRGAARPGRDDRGRANRAGRAGHTYRSRAEAEAALAPDPDAEAHWRRELLDDAHRAADAARVADPAAAARRDVAAIQAAISATAAGETLDDTMLARIAVGLADPAVRESVPGVRRLARPRGRRGGRGSAVVAPDPATPAPEVAEPATLLAFAALHHGGGITLSVALERAMRADPGHQLSRLLDQIVNAGITPEMVEEMVLGAAAETEARFHQ